MTDRQVEDLEQTGQAKSRLTIYAPIGGTVTEKLAVEGKYVTAGEPIYRIADLSLVWLMLELYPDDAARVRFGQRVEAEVQSLPGRTFEGRVAFVSPTVRKRTVRVCGTSSSARVMKGDIGSSMPPRSITSRWCE